MTKFVLSSEVDNSSRTKNNGVKIRCKHIQVDRNKFFTNDVVRDWNKLPLCSFSVTQLTHFRTNLTTIFSTEVSDKS